MNECLGADVLRDQIGVLAQPVAGPFDLDHHGMVEQAIEQRGGDHGPPKTSPHSAKPRLEVRIIAPRS
jgi:hypothetical protein